MNSQLIFFIPLALIAVATALGMVTSRNAVYAALNLIVNFASVAMLYLMLGAPFIALAQVTVYAGAIMVLFLFVIMLLGAEQLSEPSRLRWQKPFAIGMGVVLLLEAIYLIAFRSHALPQAGSVSASFSDPVSLSEVLFSSYVLPFEVTSVLLLVAMIGAIVLSRRRTRAERLEDGVKAKHVETNPNPTAEGGQDAAH
jgi:NADH-quinone oxidoreductase subunit J